MSEATKGILTAERQTIIDRWTGACNPMTGEQQICASYGGDDASFTSSDVNNILDGYYRASDLDNTGFERLLSQVHPSATPGCLCFKSLGGAENRKLADAIDDTCESEVLKGSPDAETKCDAFEAAVSRLADDPWYVEAGKYVGGVAAIWVVFGPGMSLWHKMSGRGGGGGDGNGPTGGAGGNGNTYVQVNGDATFNYGSQGSRAKKLTKSLSYKRKMTPIIKPEDVTLLGILALTGAALLKIAGTAMGAATGGFIMVTPQMLENDMNSRYRIPEA